MHHNLVRHGTLLEHFVSFAEARFEPSALAVSPVRFSPTKMQGNTTHGGGLEQVIVARQPLGPRPPMPVILTGVDVQIGAARGPADVSSQPVADPSLTAFSSSSSVLEPPPRSRS